MNKGGFQLDALYHYCRIMRSLEREIFLVNAFVESRDTAVDVGAKLGLWSYHLCRSFIRVESFEPVSEYCDVIRSTRRRNIHVHNEALSSYKGSMEIKLPVIKGNMLIPSIGLQTGIESRVVPVKRLDDYSVGKVRFVRIDVGRSLVDVLKGAERTISSFKPLMIIGIEQRHLDLPMSEVFEMLKSYGYRVYFLSGRKLRPYTDFSYELDQLPYLNDRGCAAYIHNFICLS